MASSYPYPSEVDVEKFVTVKLSKTNYLTWKTLMLRLIKEQGLEGFINFDVSAEPKMIKVPSGDSSTMITEKNPKHEDWKNSNELLQKWIIDTLSTDNDDIHTLVKRSRTTKKIWANLEKYYNRFSYPYPSSEVNVEKFVTVKLSKTNYFTWKTQMFRLIKGHSLEGFINDDVSAEWKMIEVPSGNGSRMIKEKNPKYEYWKRSDELLRKWILHTLDNDILTLVKRSTTVKQVWAKLEKQNKKQLEKNQTRYLPLMKAIVDGDWGETREFLDRYSDAIRAPITNFSSTPLLVAAESGRRNHLVRELVDRMLEGDLAHADQSGCTALHVAARGGNTEVAMLLVEKNPQLPYVLNDDEELPLHVAASNGHKDMVVYLLGVTKKHKLGTKLVNDLITGELYGIALSVVQHNPELACGDPSPLAVLAKMPSAFPSGAHLNFLQHFIYSCVPMREENINVSAKLFVPDDPTHVKNINTDSTDRGDIVSANSSVPVNVPTHVENFENHSTDRGDINHANCFVPNDPTHVENIENCSTDRGDIKSDNIFVPNNPTHMENIKNYSTDRGDIESANSVVPSVPTHVENFENHSTDTGDIESANCFVPILLHVIANVLHIKDMREKKLIHYQSQQLLKFLCSKIDKLKFPQDFSKIGEPLRIAAEDGVHEVVENIFYSFPNAIYSGCYKGQTIFHLAIVNRREKAFNLLYKFGEHYKRLLSNDDDLCNNCLHLAGSLKSKDNFNLRTSAAGAALQMQRELQWFKEVERLLPNQDKDKKNNDKKTAAMLFTETHLELVKEGEQWMKDTANSCIIVATLVVTIMFAAAITVPGGNNGDTGLPFFATKKAFIVFAISDAFALFSSTSSVLMFLSILTSRYAQDDFLFALPKRLIIGLGTLFLSILCMMIAFAGTLEILFGDKYPWIIIPVVVFASIPVILFVLLQSPLLVDMIKSTYGPGIFGKQHNRLLS